MSLWLGLIRLFGSWRCSIPRWSVLGLGGCRLFARSFLAWLGLDRSLLAELWTCWRFCSGLGITGLRSARCIFKLLSQQNLRALVAESLCCLARDQQREQNKKWFLSEVRSRSSLAHWCLPRHCIQKFCLCADKWLGKDLEKTHKLDLSLDHPHSVVISTSNDPYTQGPYRSGSILRQTDPRSRFDCRCPSTLSYRKIKATHPGVCDLISGEYRKWL